MATDRGGEGLFAALKNLLATLVAIGRTRLELLGNEVEEETLRLLDLAVKGVAALFLLGLGIILLIACIAAAFWEQRVAIFGIFAALTLIAGIFLITQAKRQATQPSRLFRSSLAELDADLARLRHGMRDRP